MEVNKIICGDCLEVMREWPDNCVDLVFCSPPYEDARTYGIDFKIKGQAWVDWCLPRFIECVRISRGIVAWVVEGKTKNFRYSATPFLLGADLHRAGVKLRKPPAFYRVGIPGSGGPDWFRNDYEFIICASKGKLPWSDNTACGHPPKYAPGGEMSHRVSSGARINQWGTHENNTSGPRNPNGSRGCNAGKPSHKFTTKRQIDKLGVPGGHIVQTMDRDGMHSQESTIYAPPVKANPGNVIKCKVGGGVMGSPLAHENEAPFPEELVERFIKSFCPPGGVVLDIFSGSGTTAATAYKHGRNYVGIDIRQGQVALAQKRLDEEKGKYGLFESGTE